MVSAGILLGTRVQRGSFVHQGFSFPSRTFAQKINSCSGSWGRFVLCPAVQDMFKWQHELCPCSSLWRWKCIPTAWNWAGKCPGGHRLAWWGSECPLWTVHTQQPSPLLQTSWLGQNWTPIIPKSIPYQSQKLALSLWRFVLQTAQVTEHPLVSVLSAHRIRPDDLQVGWKWFLEALSAWFPHADTFNPWHQPTE